MEGREQLSDRQVRTAVKAPGGGGGEAEEAGKGRAPSGGLCSMALKPSRTGSREVGQTAGKTESDPALISDTVKICFIDKLNKKNI